MNCFFMYLLTSCVFLTSFVKEPIEEDPVADASIVIELSGVVGKPKVRMLVGYELSYK